MSHTENLTIMFTDIADYSKSVATMSRKQSEEMLKAHDAILHKIIKLYKGKWIKSIGDSFLVVFRSPTDAALCAMAMHDALWELTKSVEDDSKHIRIRVALSLGEVRLTRNDVFGEAVNIAARLEGVTPADNIYLTESVYLSMNKAEVLAVKVDSERFKGSSEEIVYYKIPRSVSRRVVADESEDGEQLFDYPFGGAHLKGGAIDSGNKFNMPSPLSGIGKPGVFSKVTMGLGVLGLVALALIFFMPSNVPVEVVVEPEVAEQAANTTLTAQPVENGAFVETENLSEVQTVSEMESSDTKEFQSKLEPLGMPEPGNEIEPQNDFDPLELASSKDPNKESASIEHSEPVVETAEVVTSSASVKNQDFRNDVELRLIEDDVAGLQSLIDGYAETNPDSPYLFIVQGHQFIQSSAYREAIESYQKGLEADPSLAADEYLADRLMVLLEYQPTKTRALLKENLSPEIIDRLSERTGQRGIQSRHYAVKLLDKSDNADRIDSVGMNIWDLKELEKCKEKKIAVIALRRIGDPAALPALKEAIGGKFLEKIRYSCLYKDAKSAIAEIEAAGN